MKLQSIARAFTKCFLGVFFGVLFTEALAVISCTVAAPTLDFGTYDGASNTQPVATDNAVVTCSGGAPSLNLPYRISIIGGGSVRSMTRVGAGDRLAYGIFTDSAHTDPWDGQLANTLQFNRSGNSIPNANSRIRAHGRVRVADVVNAIPGRYQDTVTVVLSF